MSLISRVKRSARGRAAQSRASYQAFRRKQQLWQVPGHFYSPIPLKPAELDDQLFDLSDRKVAGIDLKTDEQIDLLRTIAPYYPADLLATEPSPAARYYSNNDQYPPGDAAGYTMMLRHLGPSRIVEVGSGYSTAVALDLRDRHPDAVGSITCIEPYPDRLHRLLRDDDDIDLVVARLEDISLDRFRVLDRNDVLFVDSTHVAKLGSDVNYLFERVLPTLRPGVVVHVHDVHWPFEYPRAWAEAGRAWNESYMLRAFLQYNDAFEIFLWLNYLGTTRPETVSGFPYMQTELGSGIWLKRTA